MNRIFDVADTLHAAVSADDAWQRAVHCANTLGSNAINVVEIERATGAAVWFRSAMNGQWLQEYFEQDFYTFDPLILAACKGRVQARMFEGTVDGILGKHVLAADYADQITRWGYHTLDYHVYTTATASTFKALAFSHDETIKAPTSEDKVLRALIAASVHAPEGPQSPGATPLLAAGLSTRETDILRYLATGLRNDVIAWKLGIAEVTVRLHVATARRKLGAATREEAIAVALRSGQLHL